MDWAFQPLLPATAQLQAGGGGSPYSLAADEGAVALQGRNAVGRLARRIAVSSAGGALNGQAAALDLSRAIIAGDGGFAVTGQNAVVSFAHRLAAAHLGMSMAGQPIQIVPPAILVTAEAGIASVTGNAASPKVKGKLDAASGAYQLSGPPIAAATPDAPSSIVLDLGLSIRL
jgi:hypothetical protein